MYISYAQPTNNRGYQTGAGGDYTPFPMAHKQASKFLSQNLFVYLLSFIS